MPGLIGHPGVHADVEEWPHEEGGRLDPRFRGGDDGQFVWGHLLSSLVALHKEGHRKTMKLTRTVEVMLL